MRKAGFGCGWASAEWVLPTLVLVCGAAGMGVGLVADRPVALASAGSFEAQAGDASARIEGCLVRRAPEMTDALRRRVAAAIEQESARAGLSAELVLALIEVESVFDEDAVSYAGARGLMQLLPSTVEYLLSREALRLTSDEVFRDPAVQVRLGVRYLASLQRRFGNLDLALMAYNAGPERIRQAGLERDLDRFGGYVRAVRGAEARLGRSLPAGVAAVAEASVPGRSRDDSRP